MVHVDLVCKNKMCIRDRGNFQQFNLIIKGDVDGSVQALANSLIELSTKEIQVSVIHQGVGQITESDIQLATASDAVIIGFQVRPSAQARRLAEQEGVEIRTYSVIYDAIEDVHDALEGMLSPDIREQVTGNLEVLQTFKVSKIGTIAGCMVTDGKIKRTDKVRVIRDGVVIHTGELESLKRFKDEAKEVVSGLECGINIKNYNNVEVGDIIESFEEIEVCLLYTSRSFLNFRSEFDSQRGYACGLSSFLYLCSRFTS